MALAQCSRDPIWILAQCSRDLFSSLELSICTFSHAPLPLPFRDMSRTGVSRQENRSLCSNSVAATLHVAEVVYWRSLAAQQCSCLWQPLLILHLHGLPVFNLLFAGMRCGESLCETARCRQDMCMHLLAVCALFLLPVSVVMLV